MSIHIIDYDVCLTCRRESCAYIDVVTKSGTIFSSEGSVCPTGVLQGNPALATSLPFSKKECINCGLCAGYCSKSNLQADSNVGSMALSQCSSFGLNALVSSYLNKIFTFAANSNRNSAALFDAYVETEPEEEAFVEVDVKDALECCRNLLADFLLYKGQFAPEVSKGLIVLQEIPKNAGSQIYTVIEKMRLIPQLESKQIFFTSFAFLRYLFLNPQPERVRFDDIFYNPRSESLLDYKTRIFKELVYKL